MGKQIYQRQHETNRLFIITVYSQKKASSAEGRQQIEDLTFENVVYMTSTDVAALQLSQDGATATIASPTVTVEVDKHGESRASNMEVEKEPTPSCDITPGASCDPTPYTSMSDLSVRDQAALINNQCGRL